MIIGHGLLAQSLRSEDREGLIFFCSGVSNSLETAPEAFERELDLLRQQPSDEVLIYFSTISIFNPAKQNSPYIRHKVAMEDEVRARFNRHIILRLPNMVGAGGNATNLFPYFLNAIAADERVLIYQNTHRDIMDTTALPEIVNCLLSAGFCGTLNACYSNPPTVLELYLYMCSLVDAVPNYELLPGEDPFRVDNAAFLQLMEAGNLHPETDWKKIVRRFVRLNSSHLA